MTGPRLESLSARIAGIAPVYPVGRVIALNEATLQVGGFAAEAALGDQVEIRADAHAPVGGEIIRIDRTGAVVAAASRPMSVDYPEPGWAEQFAKNTGSLLGRDLIRVDVENYSIGY